MKQQPTTIKGIKKSFFVVIEALWKRTKKSDVFYVQNYSWEWVEEALDRVRHQEKAKVLKEIEKEIKVLMRNPSVEDDPTIEVLIKLKQGLEK